MWWRYVAFETNSCACLRDGSGGKKKEENKISRGAESKKQQREAQQHGGMESKQAGMRSECFITPSKYYTVTKAQGHMDKHRKRVIWQHGTRYKTVIQQTLE